MSSFNEGIHLQKCWLPSTRGPIPKDTPVTINKGTTLKSLSAKGPILKVAGHHQLGDPFIKMLASIGTSVYCK